MLSILASFILMSFIFLTFGKSFVLYFDKNNAGHYGVFEHFFIGLTVTGALLNAWSIFLPTGLFAFAFLILASVVLITLKRQAFHDGLKNRIANLKTQKVFILISIATVFVIMLYAMLTPKLYDSYLYHINAIQWNVQYRVVPGLANLHDRFGFNSSMMVLGAAFAFEWWFGQYLFTISALCLLVFTIWMLRHVYYKKNVFGLFCLLFLYFFIQQYTLDISSPGSDMPPNILAGFVFITLLFEKNALQKKSLLFIVIPFFCITLKVSMMPVILLSFVAIWMKSKNLLQSAKRITVFGCIFVLPWLVRNIFLSGYLLYPMESLDLFSFDWKVPAEKVLLTKNWVYSWARVPVIDCSIIMKMPFSEWFPVWWHAQLEKNQYFFKLAAIAPVFYLFYYWVMRKEKPNHLLFVLAVAYATFLFWAFSAPDFRFCFAYILVLALFPILMFEKVVSKIKLVYSPILIVAMLYTLWLVGNDGYAVFKHDYKRYTYEYYIDTPIDPSTVKEQKNVTFIKAVYNDKNNKPFIFYQPSQKGTQCFDQFPCTPAFDNAGYRLRGTGLQDGFLGTP